jgi:ferredoxin
MTYVVTEPCVDCKFTYCAAVCPVEAFREGPDRLYIDPDICIDCNACVAECPVEAIYAELDVPKQWLNWIDLNAKEAPNYPVIHGAKEPLLGPKCVNPTAG